MGKDDTSTTCTKCGTGGSDHTRTIIIKGNDITYTVECVSCGKVFKIEQL